MEMVVVPPPRPDHAQPVAIRTGLAAQRLLDRRVDENARDAGAARGGFEQLAVQRRPGRRVDVVAVGGHDIGGGHVVALAGGKSPVGHRGEPDIGVEPDLMRGVAGQHRAAARLPHIADQQSRPPDRRGGGGKALQKPDQHRIAPGPVARRPHHLPVGAIGRQFSAAGKAALTVGTDRTDRSRRRRRRHAKDTLGRIGRQAGQNGMSVDRFLCRGILGPRRNRD